MASVEQELWNIFTFYTLHGNPQYPDLLKASQFVKLAKDCQMLRRNVTAPRGAPRAAPWGARTST